MNDNVTTPSDFIRDIVADDLRTGKHNRFRLMNLTTGSYFIMQRISLIPGMTA